MLIKFYYFSAVRSTDTADTATATHYVPILHWLQPRQFSSNNAQLLWLVQFYCGVAGTGAGASTRAGLVFVVICHNLTFVWFSAVPCSPRTHCSRSVSRPTVRQSSNIFACTKYLWETWPIMPPSPSIRSWMWAGDKAVCYETLNYSRAPGTDVTVSCCERSLIV